MSVSIWQANHNQPVREVDFLVVGAGLVGCAAAYMAQQAGYRVVITDKADFALGASGRNAGFMLTGLDSFYHHSVDRYGEAVTREMWDISRRTIDFWHNIIVEAGGGVQVQNNGSYLLAESPEEAAELRQAARAMEQAGIDIIYTETDPLDRDYHAAIEKPGDAAVQPYQLARATLMFSRASLITANEVYHLEQDSPDIVTVYSRKYVFHARYVLLCTNAYSALFHPYFEGKVIPTRAQAFVTAPLKEAILPKPIYSDYGYMYCRSTFDNRLLIGGGRKNYIDLENDTTEDRINDPVQNTLNAYLKHRFPDVDAPVERRWAGIMGFSADHLPLVGLLPQMSRVGFAVGFTGHGLSLGAGTAERAVDLLLNGTSPGAVDASRLH